MTTITKTHALMVIRRAFGPDYAKSVAGRLPDRIDLDNAADAELLFELGLAQTACSVRLVVNCKAPPTTRGVTDGATARSFLTGKQAVTCPDQR